MALELRIEGPGLDVGHVPAPRWPSKRTGNWHERHERHEQRDRPRALRDLVAKLMAHEIATGKAVGAVLAATLAEFEPSALRARLPGDGLQLFASTRTWDAYARFYEEQAVDLAQWAQRLVDRHFAEAYLRESMRIRRETLQRQR
jgi:predicted component of type VI protein secretion system